MQNYSNSNNFISIGGYFKVGGIKKMCPKQFYDLYKNMYGS